MAKREPDFDFYTTVDDEQYDDLAELTGEKVVHIELWEDTLGDILPSDATSEDSDATDSDAIDSDAIDSDPTIESDITDPTTQIAVDLDLYLASGIYFELYSVVCFPDPDQEPLVGFSTINEQLMQLLKQDLWLDEVAVDEDDALVLILSRHHQPQLYLMVGGWTFAEWDELPGD